mgnify:CR=1 FL=1
MTVMRKELRQMLTWCLAQRGKFRIPDAMAHLNAPQSTVRKKIRKLEDLGYLQRTVVDQKTHHFIVIRRAQAKVAASTASVHHLNKPAVKKKPPYIRHKKTSAFARVNSIFAAGQTAGQP